MLKEEKQNVSQWFALYSVLHMLEMTTTGDPYEVSDRQVYVKEDAAHDNGKFKTKNLRISRDRIRKTKIFLVDVFFIKLAAAQTSSISYKTNKNSITLKEITSIKFTIYEDS